MPLYPLPKRFHPDFLFPNFKPVGPVEVDLNHPYAPQAVILPQLGRNGLQLHDLVTGEAFDLPSGTTWSRYGIKTSAFMSFMGDLLNSGEQMSLFADMTIHTSVSDQSPFAFADGSFDGWFFYIGSNTNKRLAWYREGSSPWDFQLSSNTYAVDVPFTVGISYKGDTGPVNILVDDAEFSDTGGSGLATPAAGTKLVFNDDDSDYSMRYLFVWNKPVPVEWLRELRRDPFQVLKPVSPPLYFVSAAVDYTAELSAVARNLTIPALDVEAEIDYTAELGAVAHSRTIPALDVEAEIDYTAELSAVARNLTIPALDVEAEIDYTAELSAVARNLTIPALDVEAEIDYTADLSAVARSRTIPALDVEAEIDYTAELGAVAHSRTIPALDVEAEIDYTADLSAIASNRTVPALDIEATADYTAELSAVATNRTVPALDIEAEIDYTAELSAVASNRTVPALDVEAEIDYTAALTAVVRSRTAPDLAVSVIVILIFPREGTTVRAKIRNRSILRERQNRSIFRNKQNRSVKSE